MGCQQWTEHRLIIFISNKSIWKFNCVKLNMLCGFRGGRNGVWVGFSRSVFRTSRPQISFHHFSTLISSVPLMVCQAWSHGIRSIHRSSIKGHHRISSLNPSGHMSDIRWGLSSECFAQGQVLQYKHRNLGWSSPEGRSSTANSGIKVAVSLGMNRWDSFPLLSAPHSLLSIWTDLKRSEKIPAAPYWRWGEWIWLTGPSGLNRNSP